MLIMGDVRFASYQKEMFWRSLGGQCWKVE